jgi:hypothetical protein
MATGCVMKRRAVGLMDAGRGEAGFTWASTSAKSVLLDERSGSYFTAVSSIRIGAIGIARLASCYALTFRGFIRSFLPC